MSTIQDPGFETGTGWGFFGDASRLALAARTGSYGARIRYLGTAFTTALEQVASSEVVQFEAWLDPQTTPEPILLRIAGAGGGDDWGRLSVASDGVYDLLDENEVVVENGVFTSFDGWFRARGWCVAQSTDYPVYRFNVNAGAGSTWYVDDVALSWVDNVITKELRDALVVDLEAIDGTGIFTTTVDSVYKQPIRPTQAAIPAVAIVPTVGGAGDSSTFGGIKGEAYQTFTLRCMVRDANPHDAAMTLLDDVRNAIERQGGTLRGVTLSDARVDEVRVSDWSEVYVDESGTGDLGYCEIVVRADYRYTRGSA